MLYYSTLQKLELIRQVSLKCNNVKKIQIEYFPQQDKAKYSSFSLSLSLSLFPWIYVQCLGVCLSGSRTIMIILHRVRKFSLQV